LKIGGHIVIWDDIMWFIEVQKFELRLMEENDEVKLSKDQATLTK